MIRSDEKTRAWLEKLEHEARNHPRRHRLRLALLVLLGYAYPLLLVSLSFGLIVVLLAVGPLFWGAPDGGMLFVYGAMVLGAVVLNVAVLRTLWVRLPEPQGQVLSQADAKPLWAMIEQVRSATGALPVEKVFISTDLNAAALHRRRFGLWGRQVNYLTIGLPLLIAVTPDQLRVVLAHEFAHLRGRHCGFRAWIYRIGGTWEALAKPFGGTGWVRRLMAGWFVRWYAGYFAQTTLALRRLYEYEADRLGAELAGSAAAAGTLRDIAWFSYRLSKEFWPAMVREARHEPLPPADVFSRMARLLEQEPRHALLERWRGRELRSRTPITAEHPCLRERLEALRAEAILRGGGTICRMPEQSAICLLEPGRQRIESLAGAWWKLEVIQAWRFEHAAAKQSREEAQIPHADADHDPLELQWRQVQLQVESADWDQAAALLRDFLRHHPRHAQANFALGRLLLQQDDESAAGFLESAMSLDSACIGPALEMLLDYYRDAGRDADAEPIRLRLLEHERVLDRARDERLKVRRRERFLPHDLPPGKLEQIRRVLFRYPQINSAYLARKQVQLLADQPGYVLGVERRPRLLEDNSRLDKFLTESIAAQMPVTCAVVILGWTASSLRSRLLQVCPSPIFSVQD